LTGSACDPSEHCVTCADEGVPMRVESVSGQDAVCVDEAGAHHERVAVDLVGPVTPGDRVLVHAGVAIA
jgi:hydrogenase maturation factor